ncbi:MAG: sodium:solute symporter family protein [Methanobacteriota archaeon]|nr:MAG: sodium:solute symporter family protein [Euryarchaeota archaeon]
MTDAWIYWLAFLLYCAIVIGIGYYIWWKERGLPEKESNVHYWAAGKQLSGWSSGLSISASMMSISWSCVYGVQLFYWYGIGAAWLLIIPWLLTMAGFYTFAPLFRKLESFSQPELLEKRFGTRSRQLLAPALIFVFIVWAGAEIYAAGITIAPFLGISVPQTLLIIALVVALYSFTGGFEAVVSTDKIQFALVAFFITMMAIIGIKATGELNVGWNELIAATHKAPKNTPDAPWYLSPGFALIGLTFFAYLPGWLVETDVWIRLQAARSNREARKGILIAGINSLIFVGVIPMLIGLSALILYPPLNGQIPPDLQDGALIFSRLMQDHSTLGLNVVLGIGLVAAAMSTVDTCGNVVALSLSYDLVEPFLQRKKGWSEKKLNTLARWMSVLAIFLAYLYALNTDSLWDIFYLSSGILTTTVFLPVIAVFVPSASSRQANMAAICGFFSTLLFYYLESRGFLASLEPVWFASTQVGYILLGFMGSLVGFLIASRSSNESPIS